MPSFKSNILEKYLKTIYNKKLKIRENNVNKTVKYRRKNRMVASIIVLILNNKLFVRTY